MGSLMVCVIDTKIFAIMSSCMRMTIVITIDAMFRIGPGSAIVRLSCGFRIPITTNSRVRYDFD